MPNDIRDAPHAPQNRQAAQARLAQARAELFARPPAPPEDDDMVQLNAVMNPAFFANRERMPAPWLAAPPHGIGGLRPLPAPNMAFELAPRVPTENLAFVPVHRYGADRATRQAAGAMLAHFAPAVTAAGKQAIALQIVGMLTVHCDAADRAKAEHTLLGAAGADEEWLCITHPESTYYVIQNGAESSVPTHEAAFAFWMGVQALPEDKRKSATQQFCAALAHGQQNGLHICPPGQVQLIANYVQGYFADIYRIPPPPPEPTDVSARFCEVIEGHALNHRVPDNKHGLIRQLAHAALRDFVAADAQRIAEGHLRPDDQLPRINAVRTLLRDNIVDVYGIDWSPASAAGAVLAFTLAGNRSA